MKFAVSSGLSRNKSVEIGAALPLHDLMRADTGCTQAQLDSRRSAVVQAPQTFPHKIVHISH
jgi:hypothetical protein